MYLETSRPLDHFLPKTNQKNILQATPWYLQQKKLKMTKLFSPSQRATIITGTFCSATILVSESKTANNSTTSMYMAVIIALDSGL